jgi:hypothetical protein
MIVSHPISESLPLDMIEPTCQSLPHDGKRRPFPSPFSPPAGTSRRNPATDGGIATLICYTEKELDPLLERGHLRLPNRPPPRALLQTEFHPRGMQTFEARFHGNQCLGVVIVTRPTVFGCSQRSRHRPGLDRRVSLRFEPGRLAQMGSQITPTCPATSASRIG